MDIIAVSHLLKSGYCTLLAACLGYPAAALDLDHTCDIFYNYFLVADWTPPM